MTIHFFKLFFFTTAIGINAWLQVFPITRTGVVRFQNAKPEIAPAIKARTLEDKEVLINYGSVKMPTVLYVFEPSCSWCRQNWENVKTISQKVGKNFRILGLTLNEYQLSEHLKNNQVNIPVYKQAAAEALDALKLGSVPQTIVISPQGRIIKSWLGVYSGAVRREVEAFFRLKLPGADMQKSPSIQFCPYCIWDGRINSPGKELKVGGKKIRCNHNGKWSEPY